MNSAFNFDWGPSYGSPYSTPTPDMWASYGLDPMMPQAQSTTLSSPSPAGWSWFDTFNENGQRTGQGMATPTLNAASSIFNAYMGLKQYGLAKNQFAESKRQFGLNFDAQKRTTNAALADRQSARLASNPTAYASLADYMSQYGIQGG